MPDEWGTEAVLTRGEGGEGGRGGGQTSLHHLPIIGCDLLRHHLNTLVLNGQLFIIRDVTQFCLSSVGQQLLIDRSVVGPAFLCK